MSYSQRNPKITFISIAALISVTALACWQFYKYATFKHDNGLINIEGGVSHMVWALVLTLIACVLGFVIASKLRGNDVEDELHITSRPVRHNSPK